jgi:hypothetical protein
LVEDFLAKSNVTTLEHLPHSPDLAAADFYLLPRLIPALKGRSIIGADDIIRNAPDELKSLSQNGFCEYFHNLDSRWQKCIFAQENYFEGNVD